jgi:hypothetical protein
MGDSRRPVGTEPMLPPDLLLLPGLLGDELGDVGIRKRLAGPAQRRRQGRDSERRPLEGGDNARGRGLLGRRAAGRRWRHGEMVGSVWEVEGRSQGDAGRLAVMTVWGAVERTPS